MPRAWVDVSSLQEFATAAASHKAAIVVTFASAQAGGGDEAVLLGIDGVEVARRTKTTDSDESPAAPSASDLPATAVVTTRSGIQVKLASETLET